MYAGHSGENQIYCTKIVKSSMELGALRKEVGGHQSKLRGGQSEQRGGQIEVRGGQSEVRGRQSELRWPRRLLGGYCPKGRKKGRKEGERKQTKKKERIMDKESEEGGTLDFCLSILQK